MNDLTLANVDPEELLERVVTEVVRRFAYGATGPSQPGIISWADAEQLRELGADRIGAAPGIGPIEQQIARTIDHTLLKPNATKDQIAYLCAEAAKYGFASVCVNPFWVAYCAELLAGHDVAVCTVVGFPLGATLPEIKAEEARQSIANGATEIDMVINVGALKSKLLDVVEKDIAAVRAACGSSVLLKVIIETALLDDHEKVAACQASVRAGADFVKTSTGFSTGGATAGDVALMRRVVGETLGVKASGGVGSQKDAVLMLASGATRLGASAGVKIMNEIRGLRGGVRTASRPGGGGDY